MGSYVPHLLFLLPFALLAGASSALAAGSNGYGFFSRESHRLGVTYSNFSGDKDASLTGSSGYGIEAGISRGNTFLQILTKVRVDYVKGQAEFLDTATKTILDYKLLASNAALGIRINPVMPADPSALGVYLGGVGTFGIAQLTLPDRTYTELQSSQISTTVGYDLFAGLEVGIGRDSKHFFMEAALRTARAKLAGDTKFELDGIVLQGGLSW